LNESNVKIQSGADFNNTSIVQTGDGNEGAWKISGPSSDENNLDGTTTGNNNIATGEITGGENVITFTQTGNDNLIGLSGVWNSNDGIVIDGNINTATISQLSDLNSAVVNVSGNNNAATISQN